jgi:hydroxyacylglutathione hydrolase
VTIEIELLPALEDNYVYVLRDVEKNHTTVIDPSESNIVAKFLNAKQWRLDLILNTHHHHDHTGGNLELQNKFACEVWAFEGDAHRIPGITRRLRDRESVEIAGSPVRILHVPGHTLGAICYFFEQQKFLFTGDTMFSLGCGRLFEGTAEQMWSSLSRLKELPDDTQIFCGHEYTIKNCAFARMLEPENQELVQYENWSKEQRSKNMPTLPSTLEREKRLNPFLKSDLDSFKTIREMRNNF